MTGSPIRRLLAAAATLALMANAASAGADCKYGQVAAFGLDGQKVRTQAAFLPLIASVLNFFAIAFAGTLQLLPRQHF